MHAVCHSKSLFYSIFCQAVKTTYYVVAMEGVYISILLSLRPRSPIGFVDGKSLLHRHHGRDQVQVVERQLGQEVLLQRARTRHCAAEKPHSRGQEKGQHANQSHASSIKCK